LHCFPFWEAGTPIGVTDEVQILKRETLQEMERFDLHFHSLRE